MVNIPQKTLNTYVKKRSDGSRGPKPNHTPIPKSQMVLPLDIAARENRPPTTQELLQEARCLVGQILIGLRSGGDIYKSATAIQKVISSIASMVSIDQLEAVSPKAIKAMTTDQLVDFTQKLMSQLN